MVEAIEKYDRDAARETAKRLVVGWRTHGNTWPDIVLALNRAEVPTSRGLVGGWSDTQARRLWAEHERETS